MIPKSARNLVLAALAFGLWSVPTRPAFGWGARGHRVAARIAEARLTPEAAAAVRELLNDGDTLFNLQLATRAWSTKQALETQEPATSGPP